MRTRLTPTLIAIVSAMVLALGLFAPAMAQADGEPKSMLKYGGRDRVAIEIVMADPGSDGHRPGDLRVTSVATTAAAGDPLGRLDATLTTTVVDVPVAGDETHIGVLVFTIGESGEHQVVVEGSAHYPAQGPTIATGDVTVRPITGGSGAFAGVAGSAVTEHLEDGSWVHALKFYKSRADAAIERLVKQRTRTELREWRLRGNDLREERKAERTAECTQRKAERKAERAQRKAQQQGADTTPGDVLDSARPAVDQIYTAAAAADESGVVRTGLGIAEPGSAPGQELGLWFYAIAADQELSPHTHLGWQLARITAGELEYTVVSGEGELLRADGSSETMGPGTYLLATGDGVIENPEMVHLGANRGDEVVTIITATLFEAGEPIAAVVEDDPAEEVPAE